MIILRNIVLSFIGTFLFVLTQIYPLFKLVFFDWIGIFVLLLPWILDVWNMYKEGTFLQTDTTKKWDTIVDYIDRNRDVTSLKTTKPYHTQSFLEAKGFGLIENKGKDSVLKKGTKKYVLALENCEHTPDPYLIESSQILWEMGIRDMYTLRKLLTGQYLDAGDYKLMGQALVSMMTYHQRHGGQKLIREWETYEGPNKSFKPQSTDGENKVNLAKYPKISNAVDKILSENKGSWKQ
jgi:hypothetical protein